MYSDENPLPSVVEAYRRIMGIDPMTAGKKNTSGDVIVPCVSKPNHKHGDKTPSLRINLAKDVWICDPCKAQGTEGGKSTHLVVHAGLARDLSEASKWLAPREEKKPPPPLEQQKLTATYEYCAAACNVLYEVRRFEWDIEGGGRGKTFSQRRLLDDGSWENRLGDVDRVPYRYPQMIQAIAEGKTIYVCEGEKDVERLESVGLIATTNAGGAAWTWSQEFLECFRGATSVVVVGDNDDPGRAAARARAQALSLICGTVRLVESIPGIRHKGDISDWFDERPAAGAKEFRTMVHSCAKLVGVEVDDGSVSPMLFSVLHQRILAQQNVPIPAVPFSIPAFDKVMGGMQQGRVTVLAARTGMGKTALALHMAMLAAKKHRVLYASLEMGQLQFHDRATAQYHGLTIVGYREGQRAEREGDRQWYDEHDLYVVGGGKDATIDRLDQLIQIQQPALVVIDQLRNLRGWLGTSGDKRRADLISSEIMYGFPDLAKTRKTHFLLLHQLNRQAADEPSLEDLRDAGAVEEVADNVILLDRPYKTVRGKRTAEQTDDVMHAHLAKAREWSELFTHLAWNGPLTLPRAIMGDEERARYTRCCAD